MMKQVAVKLTNNQCTFYDIASDGGGFSSYETPVLETGFDGLMATGRYVLNEETKIELAKQIPILVKYGTNRSELSIFENFKEIPCDAGIAITLTVSNQHIV